MLYAKISNVNKLVEKYQSWSEMGKNLFLLVVVAIVGALISLIWVFLDNVGVLLGWLLGSAINIFAYFTMAKGASYLLSGEATSKQGLWAALWAILRVFLYAGALVLAGFCSFKWGSLSHGYCNLISTALGLLPTWVTLAVAMFVRNRKDHSVTDARPVEAPKDSDGEGEAQ